MESQNKSNMRYKRKAKKQMLSMLINYIKDILKSKY